MRKGIKAFALIFTMLLALAFAFPAFATASASNMNMTVSNTSVNVGDTVTVTVTINGNPELSYFTGGFRFDTSLFTCTGIQGSGTSSFYIETYDDELGSWSARAASGKSNK